jgi:hypothetical protein
VIEPEIFFSATPAAQAWHAAMQQQTAHEAACPPCRANRTTVCSDGERLQDAAHDAHAEWVVERYGGVA